MMVKLENLCTEEKTMIDVQSLEIVNQYLEMLLDNKFVNGVDINTLKHVINTFEYIIKQNGYKYQIKDFSKILEEVGL